MVIDPSIILETFPSFPMYDMFETYVWDMNFDMNLYREITTIEKYLQFCKYSKYSRIKLKKI